MFTGTRKQTKTEGKMAGMTKNKICCCSPADFVSLWSDEIKTNMDISELKPIISFLLQMPQNSLITFWNIKTDRTDGKSWRKKKSGKTAKEVKTDS